MNLIEQMLAFEGQQIQLGDMDGAILIRDAREHIESLRNVARWAAEFAPHHDAHELQEALDALPAWVLESEE